MEDIGHLIGGSRKVGVNGVPALLFFPLIVEIFAKAMKTLVKKNHGYNFIKGDQLSALIFHE